MKKRKYLIIQYLLGIIFIASGVTKLVSIDEFQVFIYSLKIFNLNSSMLFTHFIIGLELSLGLLFIFRIYTKSVLYISLGLMVLFTLFSLYLKLSDSADDCHCFGTIIQLSNTTTILKNILIIFMIGYLTMCSFEKQLKYKKLILSCCLIIGFGSSLAVRPPSILYSENLSPKRYYYKPSLDKFIANNNLTDKRQIICFLSQECKYCKLAAKKITIIADKTKNRNEILFVFWPTNKKTIDFFKETSSYPFQYVNMDVIEFLKLTNGTMPLIIVYNKGVVENAFRYKDIDEYHLIDFLQHKSPKCMTVK